MATTGLQNGSTVAVFGLRACDSAGEEVTISGLYEIVEFQPYEPAAYVWSDSFVLVPEGTPDDDWEDKTSVVDAGELEAQVDPRGFGEQIAFEREMELAQEEEART